MKISVVDFNNLGFENRPVAFSGYGVGAIFPSISVVHRVTPFGFYQSCGTTRSPGPTSIAIAGPHSGAGGSQRLIFPNLFSSGIVKQNPSGHIHSIAAALPNVNPKRKSETVCCF